MVAVYQLPRQLVHALLMDVVPDQAHTVDTRVMEALNAYIMRDVAAREIAVNLLRVKFPSIIDDSFVLGLGFKIRTKEELGGVRDEAG